MRKMFVMTGLVAAVSWGAVTAWSGPRTARRTNDLPSVSRTAVAGLADAVRSVPGRLARERVPAAQPLGTVVAASPADVPVLDAAGAAAPSGVPVTVAVRADVLAPAVETPVVAPVAVATPVAPVAVPLVDTAAPADPIVESTPLIAVYTPPVAVEAAPVGLAAGGAAVAEAAAPVVPAAPAATVEVVQCGGPDGWETVADSSACPGDRALRIERVPVDA